MTLDNVGATATAAGPIDDGCEGPQPPLLYKKCSVPFPGWCALLSSWNGATASITYSVPVMDAARGETRNADQIGHLLGLGWTSDWNAAERVHGPPVRFARRCRLPLQGGQSAPSLLSSRSSRARRYHPDALGPHLLGQTFAVVGERSLCRGVGNGRLRQRHLPLDRGDMDDDARSLLDHRRQQSPVQAHSRQKIEIELLLPLRVVEDRESARRSG